MYICIISIHVTIIDTIHCSRKAARLSNEILLCFNKERIHWAIEGHSLLNEKEKKLFLGALNTDAFPQKLTWLQKRVPSQEIYLNSSSNPKLTEVVYGCEHGIFGGVYLETSPYLVFQYTLWHPMSRGSQLLLGHCTLSSIFWQMIHTCSSTKQHWWIVSAWSGEMVKTFSNLWNVSHVTYVMSRHWYSILSII